MPTKTRNKIEKYIERKLSAIKSVDKFYIEKKDRNSVDVIVVSSNINPTSSSAITQVETTINRDYKVQSNFKVLSADI